jgi:hypothetical protein
MNPFGDSTADKYAEKKDQEIQALIEMSIQDLKEIVGTDVNDATLRLFLKNFTREVEGKVSTSILRPLMEGMLKPRMPQGFPPPGL